MIFFLGALDLGLEDLNKALIVTGFLRSELGGETQKWDEGSRGQRVGEFDLFGGENGGDNAVEGSRGSDGSDGQREYGRGGPAEHGT